MVEIFLYSLYEAILGIISGFHSTFGSIAQQISRPWYLFICMVYDWCEERFEIQSIAVPPHVNCFGGIVLTSFLFQAGSGFSLTIYYQPTVVEAFPSVQFILHHVNLGRHLQMI